MASRVSVTGGVAAALGMIPKALGRAWLALLLFGIATAIAYFPERGGVGMPTWSPAVASLAAAIVGVMAGAALYRLALTDGPDKSRLKDLGPGGLQWGGTEWLLLAANILVGLLQAVLILLLVLPLMLIGMLTGASDAQKLAADIDALLPRLLSPDGWSALQAAPGTAVFLVACLVVVILAVVVVVRFALFAPATIAEKRLVVTSAWSLSAGSTLPLLIGLALVCAPTFAFAWVDTGYTVDLSLLSRLGVSLDPIWVGAALEAAVDTVQIVLVAGFLAHAYRRVAPAREAPMQLGGL